MRISDWSSDVCSSDLQPLGDPLVIAALDPRRDVALVRQEQRPLDLEPIGGESLEPQHGLRRRRARPEILPHTGLSVEIGTDRAAPQRSEEHTSELQSLMRISYAVFCLKKKKRAAAHSNRHP